MPLRFALIKGAVNAALYCVTVTTGTQERRTVATHVKRWKLKPCTCSKAFITFGKQITKSCLIM